MYSPYQSSDPTALRDLAPTPLHLPLLTPLSCTHSFPVNWLFSLSKKHQTPPLPGPLPLLFYLETPSPRTSCGYLLSFLSFLGSEAHLSHLREASMTLSTPPLSPRFLYFVFLNSNGHNLKLYRVFVFVVSLPHSGVKCCEGGTVSEVFPIFGFSAWYMLGAPLFFAEQMNEQMNKSVPRGDWTGSVSRLVLV